MGVDAENQDMRELETKWLPVWKSLALFEPDNAAIVAGAKPKYYALTMFTYPSGDLHMGHAEVTALHDVIARYKWMRGFEVLNPVGWDSFGLPAENAAIKRGENPAEWTYQNIAIQAESFKRYAAAFDWSTRLHTSDVEYYRWTQWLFLAFYQRGLAYRRLSAVNWCPTDQTVLANEQVVNGFCERCGSAVTKRRLNQWYFKITEYAQRLLDDMSQLEGHWPERVLAMQRNWIGRSEGAYLDFVVQTAEGATTVVQVYTTRPDTIFGATFLVVAADAELATQLASPSARQGLADYLLQVRATSDIERLSTDRPKTGVDLGVTATHPVTGEQIPVWAADYVLAEYGTGAIMAVPAHDQRDLDFARMAQLPVRRVIDVPGAPDPEISSVATTGDGSYVNSPLLAGVVGKQAGIAKIIEHLEADGQGTGAVNFRLRDWLLSRQRYWGTPIPIIHCPVCGEVPVPVEDLPVQLPDLKGADLKPAGVSPLAAATEWLNVPCPRCGGPAERDADTMDTFVDSSWYFFRYVSPHDDTAPFDVEAMRTWGPIDQYVGGVEHAVLHLLYSRFFTKVLHDMGMIDFVEPFTALMTQGEVINEGRGMSKSLGNGVNLGDVIDEFGVDATRLTMVFAGPPEADIDWADMSPGGSVRFLQRALRLADDVTSAAGSDVTAGDVGLRSATHQTIADAEELIESHRFNVMLARVMELVNHTRKAINGDIGKADPAVREATETISVLLSLVAPYTAEEMWQRLGHEPSVAQQSWPVVDRSLLIKEAVTAVVQVQGKVRARLLVSPSITQEELQAAALISPEVQRALDGRNPTRTIVRAPKLVNFVI